MTTATRERPILFSGPMVRAILDGRKTQTRRLVGPGNSAFGSAHKEFFEHCDFDARSCFADNGYLHVPCHCQGGDGFPVTNDVACEFCQNFGWEGTRHRLYPHWEAGDRLWVRESFAIESFGAGVAQIRYTADGKRGNNAGVSDRKLPNRCGSVPSIHMPRHCSRITLEITGVRVERLQDTSEADAKAEGINAVYPPGSDEETYLNGPGGFIWLWNEINGKGSWESNPWVWVIEFKRLDHDEPRKAELARNV